MSPGAVSDPPSPPDNRFGACGVCGASRRIAANGAARALPLSGVLVADALEVWWNEAAPVGERAPSFRDEPNLPVCRPCLDLVLDIDRIDAVRRDFLNLLRSRVEARVAPADPDPDRDLDPLEATFGDVVRAAVREAGIADGCALVDPGVDFTIGSENPKFGSIVIRKRPLGSRSPEQPQVQDTTGEITIVKKSPSKVCGPAKKKKKLTEDSAKRRKKEKKKLEEPEEPSSKEEPERPKSRICPVCGLLLKGEDYILRKHIRVVHTKEKAIQCKFCPERFVYYKNLYAHQAKAHNFKVERYSQQCELCGKVISEKWSMNDHLLAMHGIAPKRGVRSVKECGQCGKRFLCPNKFTDHVNMHAGVRPYGCPLCPVRMVKFANLQQHCKRVHGKAARIKRDAPEGLNCELVD